MSTLVRNVQDCEIRYLLSSDRMMIFNVSTCNNFVFCYFYVEMCFIFRSVIEACIWLMKSRAIKNTFSLEEKSYMQCVNKKKKNNKN